MQIHVVQPNETLSEISEIYSVPEYILIDSNEIMNPNQLVVGQTIVIPIWGSYYFVQEGDTIKSISDKTGVPEKQIITINSIEDPTMLEVGTRLYLPQKPREVKEIGAYIDPEITGERSTEVVDEYNDLLSVLNIFSYKINTDGTLTPIKDEAIVQTALNNNIYPQMVITNIEESGFNTDLATTILSKEELQNKLLDNAIKIMKEKGYKGLDFDFEYLGKINRESYNNFLRKAKDRLKKEGYSISSALAPKISDVQTGVLYEGHDYKAHGDIVDTIYFMTYEWGWSGGPPRPVAPIDEVEKVMKYAIENVSKNKIMMGMPLYGYDWTLPYTKGGQFARAISSQQAIELARKYGVEIMYDEEAQSPYFNYLDEESKAHIVWFEDARSALAKFNLIKDLGIKGGFYWVLGRDFPQGKLLIEDNFIVKKII